MEIRAEINKINNKKQHQKFNKTKSWLFEYISKIDSL